MGLNAEGEIASVSVMSMVAIEKRKGGRLEKFDYCYGRRS